MQKRIDSGEPLRLANRLHEMADRFGTQKNAKAIFRLLSGVCSSSRLFAATLELQE
jgi:hypothetical protein